MNKLKDIYIKFLEKGLYYLLKLERWLFKRFFHTISHRHTENLKQYLINDHLIREEFIFRYGKKLFGELHPKNVLNFRYEFFKENVTKEDVVVDIACGTGLILYKIAPVIKKGIGLDYDENNFKIIEDRHKASNLEFRQADIYKIDYKKLKKETGYNVVIFSHFLEHVEDPVALMKMVSAEKILVCVPSEENWLTQFRKYLGLEYKKDPTHFKEYTREDLRKEFEAAGYEPEFIGFNPEGEIVGSARKSKKLVQNKKIMNKKSKRS